jgi:hypothetical protein
MRLGSNLQGIICRAHLPCVERAVNGGEGKYLFVCGPFNHFVYYTSAHHHTQTEPNNKR